MGSFDGKVAIITGAARGMGRATARLLAERGCKVVVSGRGQEGIDTVAEELRSKGGDAISVLCDVRFEDQIAALIAQTVEHYGRLDILDNNASDIGQKFYEDQTTSLLDMTTELWDYHQSVNVRAVMLGCKHAVPAMLKSGGGSIINLSSNSSLGGQEGNFAYGISKVGVNLLTEYVATAYGKEGIRCNCVVSGMIVDEAREAELGSYIDPWKRNNLVPFVGRHEDIANLVVFLAGDESRYITGQCIAIDGGTSAHAPWYETVRNIRGESR